MENKLPKLFKKKWVAALRSGKYKQGHQYLRVDILGSDVTEYCCLGVAAELCGVVVNEPIMYIPSEQKDVPNAIRGNTGIASELAEMNDSGKTFKQIANWIEKNL